MRNLPFKKVRLVSTEYDIRPMTDEEKEIGEGHGLCLKNDCLILYSPKAPQPMAADMVLHEICHGLWYVMSLEEKDAEENVVSRLSTGLVSLFKDNPKFTAWFLRQCGYDTTNLTKLK